MPKKRKNKARPQRPVAAVRFPVGSAVRVRPGTTDPDFPDIPLGGWAGTVQEVDQRAAPTYLVGWNQHTLEQMHPVYRQRCERDDLDVASMWLAETDLELDTGEPAVIEQPREIVTRPLRLDDEDDRVRAVFGLTSDDPVPPVSADTLRRYHEYLSARLAFPFPAMVSVEVGPFQDRKYRVNVLGLLDPDAGDEDEGLLCRVERQGRALELPLTALEDPLRVADRQLLEDYDYWLGNYAAEDDQPGPTQIPVPIVPQAPAGWSFRSGLWRWGFYGVVYGLMLGSILGAVEWALLGAAIGAALLGLVGCVAGASYGRVFGAVNRTRLGPFFGLLFGGIAGGLVGALAGAVVALLVVAYTGTILGGLVGLLLGGLTADSKARLGVMVFLGTIGAGIGAFVLAVSGNQGQALVGAAWGAAGGAAAALLLYLAVIGALVLVARRRLP